MLYNFSSTHAHTHTHFYLTPLRCASRMANIGPQSIAYLNACNHFSDPTKPCEHKQIRRLHLEKTCMYTRAKVDGTFPMYYSIGLYKPKTHLLEKVWHVLWPRMTTGCLGQSNHITNLKKMLDKRRLECIPYYAVYMNDIHELKLQGKSNWGIITHI